MRVYAISGHAQNGKDTVANMMAQKLRERGKKVLIAHNADLLKYICRTYFGWDGVKDENGRHILQYVGTDIVRQKAPSFWVDFIISILTLFDTMWDVVLIPDTRFPNEVEELKKHGFDVKHIRVIRPCFDSPLTQEQQNHPSETALDDTAPDYTVLNSGGLEYLDELITHDMKEYIYGTIDFE